MGLSTCVRTRASACITTSTSSTRSSGLCDLRVPTWAPFGLQFYCNGHSALARSLRREGIEFVQEDNAFLRVADLARAQALADSFNPEQLHRRLTR